VTPTTDAGPDRFFHVAVKADDLDGTVAFYRDAVGGDVVDESDADAEPRYVALEVADKRVYCFDRAPYEAAGLVESVPTGFLHFGFVVADVDAALSSLRTAGAEVVMEPSTLGDLRIAFVRDPTGTRVELLEEL
jgi:predicted enzyme related to lactoylglutathione lyase